LRNRWGEFTFILAATAGSENLIDQSTQGAIFLTALLSIIVSPVLLRIALSYIRRNAEKAISDAREHTSANQTRENPVSSFICSLFSFSKKEMEDGSHD
jgi:predicted Kef-type K+ transport protein